MTVRLRRVKNGAGATVEITKSNGFTLIELMVSLAILASLAAALLPMTELMARRSQEQTLKDGLRKIRSAIDAYKQASDDGDIAKVVGATG
ncbi:prepilin-type N-terminal cleavage/methylation domain-containing protein, partial [Glaciimonas sp. CA11.2]